MGLQFLFMDDNAPCHRTVAAEQLLESEDIERMDWPARSPDLNSIEHLYVYSEDQRGERARATTAVLHKELESIDSSVLYLVLWLAWCCDLVFDGGRGFRNRIQWGGRWLAWRTESTNEMDDGIKKSVLQAMTKTRALFSVDQQRVSP
ncbi:transposable element Tc3 transposase [Trichonephila clavipes]|uniref:Transposable element Tc3 transposase n=1 Tax=Trichonephila clavipes TaxID=2585209 RepID=A0A8X6VMK9_TRICX|nr:transposable element Tc3 transposase [Trichonephila clavipes]